MEPESLLPCLLQSTYCTSPDPQEPIPELLSYFVLSSVMILIFHLQIEKTRKSPLTS